MIVPAKPPAWARNRRKATVKIRQNPQLRFLSMIQIVLPFIDFSCFFLLKIFIYSFKTDHFIKNILFCVGR